MITDKCGLTDKQRFFTIMDRICYSTKKPDGNCYACEYYDDESWCEEMGTDNCPPQGRCGWGRNQSNCNIFKEEERRNKINK